MSCLARVLPGVYFPQAPPQDRLSCPRSGPALVGAAGGLSGTPGRQGACVPRWQEGRQVHLSACLLGLRPRHFLVHDRGIAVVPGGSCWQPEQVPLGLGPGTRWCSAFLSWFRGRMGAHGGDRQPFPGPGSRLVVCDAYVRCPLFQVLENTFLPGRRPSFPLPGVNTQTGLVAPIILGIGLPV